MTYLETDQLHFITRKYFRDVVLETLPNNETDWYNGYRSWLAEQGCEIVKLNPGRDFAVDILGVAPGYDKFAFADEQDATLFLLRWS
jgi:hypothetical protein